MESKIFQDIPEEKREEFLKANCQRTEEKDIQKYFSGDELTQMRADLASNLIHIAKEDEKLNKAKDEYKANTKRQYDDNEVLTKNIRYGFQEVTTQVYVICDYDEAMVGYYDNTGNLLESRRMRPEERQMRVQ